MVIYLDTYALKGICMNHNMEKVELYVSVFIIFVNASEIRVFAFPQILIFISFIF